MGQIWDLAQALCLETATASQIIVVSFNRFPGLASGCGYSSVLFTSFSSPTSSELVCVSRQMGCAISRYQLSLCRHAGPRSSFPKSCFPSLASLCSHPTARLRCRVPSKSSLLRIPSRCHAGHLLMSKNGILSTSPEGHHRWVVPPPRPLAPHQILGTPGFGFPRCSFLGQLVPIGIWVSVHDSLAMCWHIFSCP